MGFARKLTQNGLVAAVSLIAMLGLSGMIWAIAFDFFVVRHLRQASVTDPKKVMNDLMHSYHSISNPNPFVTYIEAQDISARRGETAVIPTRISFGIPYVSGHEQGLINSLRLDYSISGDDGRTWSPIGWGLTTDGLLNFRFTVPKDTLPGRQLIRIDFNGNDGKPVLREYDLLGNELRGPTWRRSTRYMYITYY